MADWNPRVNELFLKAFELAHPSARNEFLARECGDDHDLRQAVETLLRAHDEAGGFLAEPHPALAGPATLGEGAAADRSVRTDDYPGQEERVGAVLSGKYKLIEEIGEGGMGSVYMAQQTEPVKRAVAVKVIKAGMDSKAVLARFEAERQALAMMEHPNIARVLDAGTTESGRPFFVMELVKGQPITKFCDERKLTPRQRLELFVPVCQAIQHAHQKGIIHRDIKPSNVLVAMYDDRPVPKVIDFGVAKAAGQSLTDKTLMTGFGAVVGTPEYMSPEQANLNNLDIDTRSDVYSLGVLLYELLTGSTPVDRKSLGQAALLEVLRIVREVEAPRPSARLSSIDTLPSVAACRGTEPAKLSKLMKGELDWVVLKALEKDRTRRYDTANGLARDIQRYLADEVVEARPPSAGYRLKKFVRRNKVQVSAVGLVLFVLLGGIVGTTLGLLEAKRQELAALAAADSERDAKEREMARAEGERMANEQAQAERVRALQAAAAETKAKLDADERRKEAERNLAFARKGNEILGSVFTGLDPRMNYATLGEFSRALTDNLKQAVKELDGSAIGDPLEVAAMQNILGVSLISLGEYGLAVEVLQNALGTWKAKLGPDHPDTLACMNNLAWSYCAAGKLNKALTLYEETLPSMKVKLGPNHPLTLTASSNLAECYQSAGKLDKALTLFEETLTLKRGTFGPDIDKLTIMHNLAGCYRAAGMLDKALPLYEETVALRKAKLGPDHPHTLTTMIGLAVCYKDAGKPDKALPLVEEMLKRQKAKLGLEHPDTLTTMNNLASCYQDLGMMDKALPLVEETLAMRKAKLGPDHVETLSSMNNLAECYRVAGKLDKAVPLFEKALPLMKAKLDADHPLTLTIMNNLGLGYQQAGKLDRALPLFMETLALRKAKHNTDHPDTLTSMHNLAGWYHAAGKLDRALPLFEETLKLKKAKLGPDHPDTLSTMNDLARCYLTARKLDKALPMLEETLALRKAKLGPDHPKTLQSMNSLAMCYIKDGNPDKALPMLEETLPLMKAKLGPDHHDTLDCINNLAGCYLTAGKLDKAIPLFEETLPLYKAKLRIEHPDTLTLMNNLAGCYRAAGQLDKALLLFEETLALRKANLGPDHPDTLITMNILGVTYWSLKRLDKSIALFEELLSIQEKKFGRDNFNTQGTVANLGVNYKDASRLKEATPLLEEAFRTSKKFNELGWVSSQLVECYQKAGDNAKLANFFLEQLPQIRKTVPKESPQLAVLLAQIGLGLLDQKKWAEAERHLLECLAIREKTEPEAWTTFNTKSMLGGALLGQKKYTDAEPLLLAGYEGMKQREKTIPPQGSTRIPDALGRLIELYTATNKPEEVKKWQAERAKYPPPVAPPPRERSERESIRRPGDCSWL